MKIKVTVKRYDRELKIWLIMGEPVFIREGQHWQSHQGDLIIELTNVKI